MTASFALVSKATDTILSPDDVAGKVVAVTGYPLATQVADRFLPRSKRQIGDSRSDVLRSVCNGKAVAGFDEASYLNMLLLDRPPDCDRVALRIQTVDGAISPVTIGARFDAGDAADELRAAFDDLAADGTMTTALNRWASFSVNETRSIFELREAQERRARLQWGLAICLLALALLLGQVHRARRAAREARQASAAKSEFLANMSHEIRTPMNGVLGMMDLVLGAPLTEDRRGDLQIVRDSAASLLAILTDVLDLSKIEAGCMKIFETSFDPRAGLAGVLRLFEGVARDKGLELVLIANDVPDRVVGDLGRLRQVITNLVSNAVKFTDQGRVTLQISATVHSTENVILHIAVRDTGIGIPLDQQQKLFSKFTQVDSSPSRLRGGTGLGLSIAKSIVELLQGKLRLSSLPGSGSLFEVEIPVRLPLLHEVQPSPAPLLANQSPMSEMRVLVAEDNRTNQVVISRSLEKLGYAVDIAENGERAIEYCRTNSYAAILMDCQMPVMDGYEAAAEIRRGSPANRSVPIIAVTAHAMGGDRERCLAAGMTAYLTKPISQENLIRTLASVMNAPEA